MPIFPHKNLRWLLSRQFNLNFFRLAKNGLIFYLRTLTCMNVYTIITGAQFLVNFDLPTVRSKIEKVPRGIRGEKSSKDMASSRNLVSTIGALWGTEPGVRKGKRSLLASHTRCKCSMETTHNSVKVKLGIKVMKLVESLIGREVTVGQGSECHLTFVRGLLHIAQQDPRIDHKTS